MAARIPGDVMDRSNLPALIVCAAWFHRKASTEAYIRWTRLVRAFAKEAKVMNVVARRSLANQAWRICQGRCPLPSGRCPTCTPPTKGGPDMSNDARTPWRECGQSDRVRDVDGVLVAKVRGPARRAQVIACVNAIGDADPAWAARVLAWAKEHKMEVETL